jgi:hypothetical protein
MAPFVVLLPGGGSATISVQDAPGLARVIRGYAGGEVTIRVHGSTIGGTPEHLPATLPAFTILRQGHRRVEVYTLNAKMFSGPPAQVSMLHAVPTIRALCRATPARTAIAAVAQVGRRIYRNEATRGGSAVLQLTRIAHDPALLAAVRQSDTVAIRAAIDALLNQHVVRLRVTTARGLTVDVGGPYVLAPRTGTLKSGTRTLGSFVLSVQDDMGYLLLAHRLIGVEVLMRQGPTQVLGTLTPGPASVPNPGVLSYGGRRYEAFTFKAHAFLGGPLSISLLEPLPPATA